MFNVNLPKKQDFKQVMGLSSELSQIEVTEYPTVST